MVFDKNWFHSHQEKLLWFCNHFVLKFWFRWVLRIHGDLKWSEKIILLEPNNYKVFLRYELRKGRVCQIVRRDFRTHDKFGKRLYHAFKPLWYVLHFLDWLCFDDLDLSFGFLTFSFYPVAGANSPCDGMVARYTGPGESLTNLRNGAGTEVADVTSQTARIFLTAGGDANEYVYLQRLIFLFDTSSLDDTEAMDSASFSLFGHSKVDEFGGGTNPHVDIVASTPAGTDNLVTADYSQLGSTIFGSVTYAAFSIPAYNDMALDANGRANISKTGISKFGARISMDTDNSVPGGWVSGANAYFTVYMADYAGTDHDPKLTVVYPVILPTIGANSVNTIFALQATGLGAITAEGRPLTERGIVWGTSANPTTADNKIVVAGTTGSYTATITGLSADTTYHMRAFATNADGTAYGTDVEFKTIRAFIPQSFLII